MHACSCASCLLDVNFYHLWSVQGNRGYVEDSLLVCMYIGVKCNFLAVMGKWSYSHFEVREMWSEFLHAKAIIYLIKT